MDNPENNAQLDIVQQRWRDITLPEARRVLLALAEPLSASAMISRSARPTAAGAMVATDCGNGVAFVDLGAVSRQDAIAITVTNDTDKAQSFVILNHNPQRR